MSELFNKSFHCKACNKTLKTYLYMRKHLCVPAHKNNVVKYYPETLLYRKIGDIEIYTGRLNLKKIRTYMKPVPKIKIEGNKQKKDKVLKPDPVLNVEKYEQEYYNLDKIDMIRLIDQFVVYLKFYKIDPENWFSYEYFMKYRDIDEEVMEAYIEVRDLVLDDDFLDSIKK